jgi:hypothetical protein
MVYICLSFKSIFTRDLCVETNTKLNDDDDDDNHGYILTNILDFFVEKKKQGS